MTKAHIGTSRGADGGVEVTLSGPWTLAVIAVGIGPLERELGVHAAAPGAAWNLLEAGKLDSAGALLLWRAWGRQLPALLRARPEQLRVFERIAAAERSKMPAAPPRSPFDAAIRLGDASLDLVRHGRDFVALVGQIALDFIHLVRVPRDLPGREISANLYKGGVRAMPVTVLVGFLIGVVLSYLSALQLKQFGADVFIVNLLGLGLVREIGPVLVAVLVAGRSGSAMTAQLGVMRVTEEIDALATMGVPQSLRLVFPKVVALALAMPLLVLWTTAIALLGGMVAANLQLDVSYGYFLYALPRAVPLANLWIGLSKGVVFGVFVALVACHFGLRVRPNTESLSANTTASVVASITVVILLDAVFAIVTRGVGLPR